jgi:ornithine cyclodeaminase/alanine dehydrogenase-like protein (mu-crystallin family)
MKIVTLDEIRGAIDMDRIYAAIREGFIALSQGRVTLGAVGYLGFPKYGADCHIKSAASADGDVFAVKIASTFAGNTKIGLRTSDGMMLLFNAHTGEPLALLEDRGWLTDLRTAIAGAIATKAILPNDARTIGVVGTGIQAELHATLAAEHCDIRRVVLWGRRHEEAERLALELTSDRLNVQSVASLEELASVADVVITTTPARMPLLTSGMFERPPRIVAVGADAPGKQELASDLTASMTVLVADSVEQCLDHGELSRPYRDGLLAAERVTELGSLLANPVSFSDGESVLVDLTGVGVQDLQIAEAVWTELSRAATSGSAG